MGGEHTFPPITMIHPYMQEWIVGVRKVESRETKHVYMNASRWLILPHPSSYYPLRRADVGRYDNQDLELNLLERGLIRQLRRMGNLLRQMTR